MSVLNRALIAAYQRRTVVPRPHASFPSTARGEGESPGCAWPEPCRSLLAAAADSLTQLACDVAAARHAGPKLVVVTSCRRGEGRTTLALVLARYLADQGHNVLLVDADLERPKLAERLRLHVAAGSEDVLTGRVGLAGALIEAAERTTLLPLRGPRSAHQLESSVHRLGLHDGDVLRRFDCICVDTPPLATTAGPLAQKLFRASVQSDTAVVVCDRRQTPPHEVDDLARQLVQAGVARWHLIENFT